MSDVWENARRNAKPGCPMCNGTGTYMYDHNHGTVCKRCCQHNMGWWQLTEAYGDAGKWCCKAGCGAIRADQPPKEEATKP